MAKNGKIITSPEASGNGYRGNSLIGLTIGLCLGNLFNEKLMPLYQGWTFFLKALQAVALPLVFLLLATSILQLFQQRLMIRSAVRGISYIVLFAFSVALLSIAVTHITLPGNNDNPALQILHGYETTIKLSLIPDSFLTPFIGNNFMQIVLLSLLTAMAVTNSPEKYQKNAVVFFETATVIFRQMLQLLISLLPIALVPLGIYLANHFQSSWEMIKPYIVLLLSVFLLLYLLPGLILQLAGKISPLPFYRKSLRYQFLSLTTGSSKVTLPKNG